MFSECRAQVRLAIAEERAALSAAEGALEAALQRKAAARSEAHALAARLIEAQAARIAASSSGAVAVHEQVGICSVLLLAPAASLCDCQPAHDEDLGLLLRQGA
jgi:hypothetical protein